MVFGVDDAVGIAVFFIIKEICAYGIKKGSDWYVNESLVGKFEKIYQDAKGQFDRRRKPWTTIRRFIAAYRTGDKDKYQEIREILCDLKDELTKDAQDALSDKAAEALMQVADAVTTLLEAMPA
jgi:hypothetical protein